MWVLTPKSGAPYWRASTSQCERDSHVPVVVGGLCYAPPPTMFDSVRSRSQRDAGRWSVVALIAVALHGAAVAGAVTFQAVSGEELGRPSLPPELVFFSSPPSLPAPPPPPAPSTGVRPPKASETPALRRTELLAPASVPQSLPPPPEPAPEPAAETASTDTEAGTGAGNPAGEPGGEEGGTPGGSPGGLIGGAPGGTGAETVLPFGEGMTRPECDRSLAPIEYTREAREARVEGLLIIRCTVRIDGTVRDCRAVKGLPHMTEAALEQMPKWKCTPATFQGRPVNIDYVFNVRLVMPKE